MKIPIYAIDKIKPIDSNEYENFCEIFDVPSLKFGSAEFLGEFSHFVTKQELNKLSCADKKYYDRGKKCFRTGLLILNYEKKYFAIIN